MKRTLFLITIFVFVISFLFSSCATNDCIHEKSIEKGFHYCEECGAELFEYCPECQDVPTITYILKAMMYIVPVLVTFIVVVAIIGIAGAVRQKTSKKKKGSLCEERNYKR